MRLSIYIICFICLASCEDVVDVDLEAQEPQLIINAILRVNEDNPQPNRIKVTQSVGFFDIIGRPEVTDLIPPVGELRRINGYAPDPDDPNFWVPGSDGVPFEGEQLITGPFEPGSPEIFFVAYKDEVYLAFYNYTTAPPIDDLQIGDGQLLDEDETEIILTFTDPPETINYYVVGYGDGDYVALEDRFFNGQQYSFSYFKDETLNSGDELTVTVWGVDENLYNYFTELIEQSEMGENPLFATPVSTVRGNFLKQEGIDNIETFNNLQRPDDFILGYFAVIQERTSTLIIE